MKNFKIKKATAPFLVLVLLAPALIGQEVRETRELTPIASPRAKITSQSGQPKLPALTIENKERRSDKDKTIQDSVSATDLAWAYYNKGEWKKAQEWFTTALEWHSGNMHAAEGMVLSVFEGGDPQMAYQIAGQLDSRIPGIRAMIVDSAVARGRYYLNKGELAEARKWVMGFPSEEQGFAAVFNEVQDAIDNGGLKPPVAGGVNAVRGRKVNDLPDVATGELLNLAKTSMQEGRHRVSQWYLDQAENRQPLMRDSQIMRAWNYYHTRQFDRGATAFEKLYRAEENLECAEGLSYCLQQGQDVEKLTELSAELGGMLMATAGPVIQAFKGKTVETKAQERSLAEIENELPYAPIPALRAAGEEVPVRKTLTRRLQAQR